MDSAADNIGLLNTVGGSVMSVLNNKNIEYEKVDEIRGRAVLKHDAVTKNKTIISVQWTKRVGIDDTSTTVYQFDHKPTKNDINKADKNKKPTN